MHILLVDDDGELCSLLKEFLTREGFTVLCEHEGHRGLASALEPGVGLVVLDVMLPGIVGFEILRRLRQQTSLVILQSSVQVVGHTLLILTLSAQECPSARRAFPAAGGCGTVVLVAYALA